MGSRLVVNICPCCLHCCRQYGFFSYLRDLFDCPDAVMCYLCLMYRAHLIPVGTRETKNQVERIMRENPTFYNFYTEHHQVGFFTGFIRLLPLSAVWHRPTRNMARRSQPERGRQTTDRPATQPPSPPAREESPTVSFQHLSLLCKLVSRSGNNSGSQPIAT